MLFSELGSERWCARENRPGLLSTFLLRRRLSSLAAATGAGSSQNGLLGFESARQGELAGPAWCLLSPAAVREEGPVGMGPPQAREPASRTFRAGHGSRSTDRPFLTVGQTLTGLTSAPRPRFLPVSGPEPAHLSGTPARCPHPPSPCRSGRSGAGRGDKPPLSLRVPASRLAARTPLAARAGTRQPPGQGIKARSSTSRHRRSRRAGGMACQWSSTRACRRPGCSAASDAHAWRAGAASSFACAAGGRTLEGQARAHKVSVRR